VLSDNLKLSDPAIATLSFRGFSQVCPVLNENEGDTNHQEVFNLLKVVSPGEWNIPQALVNNQWLDQHGSNRDQHNIKPVPP
jgi:hypothetical protein